MYDANSLIVFWQTLEKIILIKFNFVDTSLIPSSTSFFAFITLNPLFLNSAINEAAAGSTITALISVPSSQLSKFIREKQTQTWIETRKAGKLTRKAETDTIKNLVEYAKGQGSQHADKLYMTYSKLANKMAGISKRDEATVMQLNNLSLMEHIILCVIDSGIIAGKHYKEIYQDCKKRLETVKDLAYLEQSA
mgnify:CR=1 FL=1